MNIGDSFFEPEEAQPQEQGDEQHNTDDQGLEDLPQTNNAEAEGVEEEIEVANANGEPLDMDNADQSPQDDTYYEEGAVQQDDEANDEDNGEVDEHYEANDYDEVEGDNNKTTPPKVPLQRAPSLFDAAPSGTTSAFAARPAAMISSPTQPTPASSFSGFAPTTGFASHSTANPFGRKSSSAAFGGPNTFTKATPIGAFGTFAAKNEDAKEVASDATGDALHKGDIVAAPTTGTPQVPANIFFTSTARDQSPSTVFTSPTTQKPFTAMPSSYTTAPTVATIPTTTPSIAIASANPPPNAAALLKEQKEKHDTFVSNLQAKHKKELESVQQEAASYKHQLEALQSQLSLANTNQSTLAIEKDKATKHAEQLQTQLQTTVAYRDTIVGELNAVRRDLANANAQILDLKQQLSFSPKQQRVVEELSRRLESWFGEYAGESEARLAAHIKGYGGSEESSSMAEDDNAHTMPSNISSLPGLRSYFSQKLIEFAEQNEKLGADLAEARAATASSEAEVANLNITLQNVQELLEAAKASDGSRAAETEGRLTDALSQIEVLTSAGVAARAAVEASNEATLKAREASEEVEKKYSMLLATKEQLSEELRNTNQSHGLALRSLQTKFEAAEVRHAEDVGSLKRHISTLTELAAEASAASAASAQKLARAMEQDAAEGNNDEEPPTKTTRVEKSLSPAGGTTFEEDSQRAAEKLLATRAPEFTHSLSNQLPPQVGVEKLKQHAASLGLPELGSKRGRTPSRSTESTPVVIPSFAEAAAFFTKGKDYIAAVNKDNEELRNALAGALQANRKMKELEASRSKTVGTFAALHEEIEHLRADNKHVRDELAGVREENGVLTSQLVSTMLSSLRASSSASVASPIAPLPPSNIESPFSVFGQSPRLHPQPSPTASPTSQNALASNVQKAVLESLATIRRCATEISVRNSSITTNPEVQAAAAHQLQSVKNETLRLTKHKEALLKLIEPRERRLASVTAQLVRLAAQGHSSAADGTPLPPTALSPTSADRPTAVSPSRPVHQIVDNTLAHHATRPVSTMASLFGYSDCLEAAIALALGMAEEQRSLLFVPDPQPPTEANATIMTSTKLAPQRSALLASALRTPSALLSNVSRTATPPLLAIGEGAMLMDQLDLPPTALANPSPFAAELLVKMGSLSVELERLRMKVVGEEGSAASRHALSASVSATHHNELNTLQQAGQDKDRTINALRAELAAAKRAVIAAQADATAASTTATALKTLATSLANASGLALNACESIANSRATLATDLSKLRTITYKSALSGAIPEGHHAEVAANSISLTSVVEATAPLPKRLTEAFQQLSDSGRISANTQQLVLSSGLCQVVNQCDTALSKIREEGITLARNHALQMLKQRVTHELLDQEEAAMKDVPPPEEGAQVGEENMQHEATEDDNVNDEDRQATLEEIERAATPVAPVESEDPQQQQEGNEVTIEEANNDAIGSEAPTIGAIDVKDDDEVPNTENF